MASAIFRFALAVRLGSVGGRSLPLGGGVCVVPLLQQSPKGYIAVQDRPYLLHVHAWDIAQFMVGALFHHWGVLRHLGASRGGGYLLGRPIGWSSGMVSSYP